MTSVKRIKNVIFGLLMLLASVLLMVYPEDGYYAVVVIIDISFLIYGIRMLIYYFTMARYMVGGIMTLYKSIIAIDFGIFIFKLNETPVRLVMIYLMGIMAFNGFAVILKALDEKKLEIPSWRNRMIYGIIRLILTLSCLCFWNSARMVTIIYSLGLIHSAIYNIAKSFQKTAIIHIE